MEIGVMPLEMIEMNKNASDVIKRVFQKRLHGRKCPHIPQGGE